MLLLAIFGIDDAALIVGGLAAAGGAAGGLGQLWSSHKSAKAQKTLNKMQMYLAQHAHEIEVADLRKAGLNPILSANGSGAAVPQMTAPDYSGIGQGIGQIGSSLGNALSGAVGLSQQLASVDNTKTATALNSANVGMVNARNKQIQVSLPAEKAKQQVLAEYYNTPMGRSDIIREYHNAAQKGEGQNAFNKFLSRVSNYADYMDSAEMRKIINGSATSSVNSARKEVEKADKKTENNFNKMLDRLKKHNKKATEISPSKNPVFHGHMY